MVALVVGRHPPPGLPPLPPPAGAKPRSLMKGSNNSRSNPMGPIDIDLPSWTELKSSVLNHMEDLSGKKSTEASVPLANGRLPSPSAKVILQLPIEMQSIFNTVDICSKTYQNSEM